MSGGFISDLKIGYWLGTTPAVQQKWKFLGTIVAAVSVTAVIMMLAKPPGFEGEGALPAPQANAMAALIEPLMTGQPAPWLLYMAGMVLNDVYDFEVDARRRPERPLPSGRITARRALAWGLASSAIGTAVLAVGGAHAIAALAYGAGPVPAF